MSGAMLITYADSLGGDLRALNETLGKHFDGVFTDVHILPFFPSSADGGFAPLRYDAIEEGFGDWGDIAALSENYGLMFDFMINHISAQSPYYFDFLANKDDSPYKDFFIRWKDFWDGGEPTEEQTALIYKRKPRAPYVAARFADGTEEKVWCTFGEEQIDLNVNAESVKRFIADTLQSMAAHGAKHIRLDAFAYAVKKAGTSCFFVEPEIWGLLGDCSETARSFGMSVLPEIHEHFTIQQKLAAIGYPVYDFALPLLMLQAIYYGETRYLKHWFDICPRNQYTTLDTHDGIGVVDARDLLPDEEIDRTREDLFKRGANVKKIYSTAAYNNLDIYQVNCTYYSALGDDDEAYLLARAVQLFAPGTPQIYYIGLLAGANDLEYLELTKEGRSINRHKYTADEIEREVARPVVKRLVELIKFRNTHKAFSGSFAVETPREGELVIEREHEGAYARLTADFKRKPFNIEHS